MSTTKHALGAAPRHRRATAALDFVLALVAVVLTPVVEWFDDKIAEPTAKWWRDLEPSEKVAAAVQISIAVGVLVGVIIAMAGTSSAATSAPAAPRIDDHLVLSTEVMARVLDVNPEALAAALTRTVR